MQGWPPGCPAGPCGFAGRDERVAGTSSPVWEMGVSHPGERASSIFGRALASNKQRASPNSPAQACFVPFVTCPGIC